MIIVKLMGGLGNQMFQYAAAKRLAVKRGTTLKLEISLYRTEQKGLTFRHFELDHFNLKYTIAKRNDLFFIVDGEGVKARVKRFIIPNKYRIKMIRENLSKYDESILEALDNVYLEGYWQSEKYFKDIEGIIRKEYLFKDPQKGENRKLAHMIASTESVSLHIRRGDYISDIKTNEIHGACDIDYYFRAITEIEKRTANPHFFVFSDDIQWAKDNLMINHPVVFVDHNAGHDAFEDMRLISQCMHNIIANSSFSWWGAWLNNNPEKIVVAPAKWNNKKDVDMKDIIPDGWLKI